MNKISFLIIVCFFILMFSFKVGEKENTENNFWQNKSIHPFVIGHRGMMPEYPENTLAGFSACIEQGIGIEIDVRTSEDNELIIIHDNTFARTTDGPDVLIGELTLAEIKKLDAGSWFRPKFKGERVPTLEETLKLVSEKQKGKVSIAVNIKDISESGEDDLIALLKKYDLIEQAFCFDQDRACSERLKAIDKRIRIAQNVEKEKLQQVLDDNFLDVFLIWFSPTRDEVEKLHHAGKEIVLNLGGPRAHDNDPAYWHGFLTSGIDAIIIDHAREFNDYIKSLK